MHRRAGSRVDAVKPADPNSEIRVGEIGGTGKSNVETVLRKSVVGGKRPCLVQALVLNSQVCPLDLVGSRATVPG